jgi:hypothetical protein
MCWGEPPSTQGGILFSNSVEDPCSSTGVVYSSLSRSLQDPIEVLGIVSCASLVSFKKNFLHMAKCVAHPTHYLLSNPTLMHPLFYYIHVVTPLWAKWEDETHTPKSGDLESSGTPATSELDNRGQNTSPWGVLYTVGKVSKFRCPKWPRMSHLDIWSPSYGQKKGQESNW